MCLDNRLSGVKGISKIVSIKIIVNLCKYNLVNNIIIGILYKLILLKIKLSPLVPDYTHFTKIFNFFKERFFVLKCTFFFQNVISLTFQLFQGIYNPTMKFHEIGENYDFSFGPQVPILQKFLNSPKYDL